MAVDVETLLAPVSDDNPVGEDLAYDSERQEIEAAFERTAAGGSANDGDTDWRAIVKLIEQQSARTKDIWLAAYLIRAGASMAQLPVVATGADYLAGLVETYWDKVHPQLEEYGFQGRKTPVESLTRIGEFLGPLRNIILIRHPRLGEYSSADIERFARGGDSEDGYGMFRGAMQETAPEDLEAVAAQLDAIKASLVRADTVMTANSGGETSVNFQPTYEALASIRKALAGFLPNGAGASEEASADSNSGSGGSSAASSGGGRSGGMGAPGSIESREDVMKALDAIADYYRRREPTSPVPLALKRAREWVTLDFLTVLEDIAPNSMEEARRVLMSNRAAPESGGESGW